MDPYTTILIMVQIASQLFSIPVRPSDSGEDDSDDDGDDGEREPGMVLIDWGDCSKQYGRRRR